MRTRPNVPDTELSAGGEFQPLPEGEYDFQVRYAEAKKSASGNDMIELVLTVWGRDGSTRTVWDYLIDLDSMEWKTRQFCQAVGLEEAYKSGQLSPADCQGVGGRACLKVQAPRTVNGKTYDARNVVKQYVAAGPSASRKDFLFSNGSEVVAVGKEEIPF